MTKNLSSDGLKFPVQRAIVASEPRTALAYEACLQDSADRDEYVKRRLDYLHDDGEGARRMRQVASLAALREVTERPHRSVVIVDGVGIYQFDAASDAPELSPIVIKPTKYEGRWIVAGLGGAAIDAAHGIPSLDEDGLLPTERLKASAGGRILGENIKFGLVDLQARTAKGWGAEEYKTASTNFVDVPAPHASMNAKKGDLLKVEATFLAGNDQGNYDYNIAEFRLALVAPTGTTSEVQGTLAAITFPKSQCLISCVTIAADGAHVVKLQYRVANGEGNAAIQDISMITELRRP